MHEGIVHLFALERGHQSAAFLEQLNTTKKTPSVLIKGIPHGWVHPPHSCNRDALLGFTWDLFILSIKDESFEDIPPVQAHLSVVVSIPDEQFERILEVIGKVPQPSTTTPDLPAAWRSSSQSPNNELGAAPTQCIPTVSIVPSKIAELGPGELRLDAPMATYLSTAIPAAFSSTPVCFFNLFRYRDGDRAVHDSYMEGFKKNFGDAAGAQVKFMGPCASSLQLHGQTHIMTPSTEILWNDANLVQYDSVWHYAYMLSTGIYKKLNEEKVAGLEDTCILLISEMELTGVHNA